MINVKVIALAGPNLAINNFDNVEELNEYTYNLQDGEDFKLVGVWRSKDGRESIEVYADPEYIIRKGGEGVACDNGPIQPTTRTDRHCTKDMLMCPVCGTIATRQYWKAGDELACPVCKSEDIPNHMTMHFEGDRMFLEEE